MKNFLKNLKYLALGAFFVIGGTAMAVQISVPSSNGPGQLLQSLSTGNYGTVSLTAGSNVTIATTSSNITINSSGGGSFPFTPQTYGVSTSTTVAFLNGLFSTASSTFSNTLFLPLLGTPAGTFIAVNPSGQIIATTTPSGGGSGTVGSGTTGQFPYYASNGTTLTATSTIFVSTASNIGFGNTSPTTPVEIGDLVTGGNERFTPNGGSTGEFQLFYLSESAPRVAIGRDMLGNGIPGFIEKTGSSGTIANTGVGIGSPIVGGMDFYTSDGNALHDRGEINSSGLWGIGTTTPIWILDSFSSTQPQLSLSAGAGINQWTFRTETNGDLSIATTTIAGTATSSQDALKISTSGFGTTTILGLNITGQATSTSNVGFNITNGCFAIAGICIGTGSGAVSSVSNVDGTLTISPTTGAVIASLALGHANTWTGLQTFTNSSTTLGSFGYASSTLLRAGTFTLEPAINIGPGCASFNGSGQLQDGGALCGSITGSFGSGGTTGLTLTGGASTGIVTLTLGGTLNVANGGTASTTLGGILAGAGTSAVKSVFIGSNLTWDGTTLAATGGGGGISDPFTHPLLGLSATTSQMLIGTSTAGSYQLTLASSTALQLSLSAGAGVAQWAIRNAGGNLYFATTTVAGTATTSQAAFSEVGAGAPVLGIGTTTPFAVLAAVNTSGVATPLFAIASSTATGSTMPNFEVDKNGHIVTSGPKPTLSSCGTSPSVTGNDADMVVTVGSVSATGCTITFANAYATAPVVLVDNQSMSITNALTMTVSASAITLTQTGLTGAILDIMVHGIQ